MGGVIPRPLVSILLLLIASVKDANPISITIVNAKAQHLFPISAAGLKQLSEKKKKAVLLKNGFKKTQKEVK